MVVTERAKEDLVNLIPFIAAQNVDAIASDRMRAAEAARRALGARTGRAATDRPDSVMVRLACLADDRSLAELAQLDSGRVPEFPALLAEVDGRVRAAISINGGAAVADPFFPSAGLVELLALRAAQVRAELADSAPAAPEVRRAARVATEGGVHHP
jgi:hypothetical protein